MTAPLMLEPQVESSFKQSVCTYMASTFEVNIASRFRAHLRFMRSEFQALERVEMYELGTPTKWRHFHYGWFVGLRTDTFEGVEAIFLPLQGNRSRNEHKLVHI